jgi:fatty acid-binding protein DegV
MEIRRAVVVDAGCDLSTQDLKRLGISVWPIEVVREGIRTLDVRDDAATANFYARFEPGVAQTQPVPAAAAREHLLALTEHHDHLLFVAIAASRSPVLQCAKDAFDQLPPAMKSGRKVRHLPPLAFAAVDSEQLFAGHALVAAQSAEWLKTMDLAATEQRLRTLIPSVYCYNVPADLKTVRARARLKGDASVSFFSYAIGTALDVKPIVLCHRGKTGAVERIRGFERGVARVVDAAKQAMGEGLQVPQISVVYGGPERELQQFAAYHDLEAACQRYGVRLLTATMGITGVANVGPGSLSIAFAAARAPIGDANALT